MIDFEVGVGPGWIWLAKKAFYLPGPITGALKSEYSHILYIFIYIYVCIYLYG